MSASVACSAKHILVVDDDASVRSSLKILLTIDRHEVTEAANGQDALYLFTGAPFDLVIIDYFMPDMLGDELAQNLRRILIGGDDAADALRQHPRNTWRCSVAASIP